MPMMLRSIAENAYCSRNLAQGNVDGFLLAKFVRKALLLSVVPTTVLIKNVVVWVQCLANPLLLLTVFIECFSLLSVITQT
jgi:hypothetical protein